MLLTVLIVLVIMGGCSPVGPREPVAPLLEDAADGPVWPPAPDRARIAYLASVSGTRDLGVARSFLRRLGEAVVGVSEEWLIRPTGVAAKGNMLAIADPGAPALFLFDRASRRFRRITQANGEDLVSPVGVALAGENTVYLVDSYLHRIYVYGGDGRFRDVWAGEDLKRPTGLAVDDSRNRLYVSDTAAHRILAYDLDGRLLFSFGQRGTADGEFNWPSHLCLDREGLLYVVDALGFRVQAFDADGRFLSKFGHHGDGSGDFARPKGIAADSEGHIYVADALFDTVQIFDRQGKFLMAFGQQGNRAGEFWLPVGLAIDEQDRIYAADSYNQRVQVFQFIGEQ